MPPETAKLETDDGDGPFASNVEADLEEDEAVMEDGQTISTLASQYVYPQVPTVC